MTQTWRNELRMWAQQTTTEFATRDGILGVAIGGSLARGQEWRHSDLEMGVLVEQRDAGLPYFNVYSGRGVEVIQLARGELEEQLRRVEGGDGIFLGLDQAGKDTVTTLLERVTHTFRFFLSTKDIDRGPGITR